MKKALSENLVVQLILLSIVILLSRIPFLWAGFGAEEDSWLLAITAKQMTLSGTYEMSRAPGHPLQEYLYAWMYQGGLSAFATNLISTIGGLIATIFFALALRNLQFKHYLFAAYSFAFTPAIYIASTYTIDYMLAMAFVMISFYFVTKQGDSPILPSLIAGGISLGLAIGFRITSGAMLIPFLILLWPRRHQNRRALATFIFLTTAVALLTYIPVLKTYGLTFFHYSDQFPYPNTPKVLYKLSIGVFGVIGVLAIIFFKGQILLTRIFHKEKMIAMPSHLLWAGIATIIIYLISYFRLPQKSAYLIPVVPFIILMFGYYLSDRLFKLFCALLCLSSFLMGINLTDPLRGSMHSLASLKFTIAGQEIFIDPLSGPIMSDYTKRLNKMTYTEKVFQKIQQEQQKIVLICGWWQNELVVKGWNIPENKNVILTFYIDRPAIEKYLAEGYMIYYLPEQDLYNDQYSQMTYTDSVAKPYNP